MDDTKRLQLIAEAVRYCQRVAGMGMPPSCYSKALREPIYYLWDSRERGSKDDRAKFRSRAAVGLKRGGGKLQTDHAIPFKYLQVNLLALTDVTADSVRAALEKLEKFTITVLITEEENRRLNARGYRSAMPDDWDGIDPLARYKAVGIEVIENTNISN
jgi:hypothetical protein